MRDRPALLAGEGEKARRLLDGRADIPAAELLGICEPDYEIHDDQCRRAAHAGALAHALAVIDLGFRMPVHATCSRSRSDWIMEDRSR